jgi:MerR family transcriptional regulator, mercuric resistance operon regulatory protein
MLPKPLRTVGGRRTYGSTQVQLLAFIKRSRELGFSPDDVRKLLQLGGPDKAPCRQVREIALDHLSDIRAKISDLRKLERLLAKTVAKCTGTTAPECPVLDILDVRREKQPHKS